jgi:hypothetical protein
MYEPEIPESPTFIECLFLGTRGTIRVMLSYGIAYYAFSWLSGKGTDPITLFLVMKHIAAVIAGIFIGAVIKYNYPIFYTWKGCLRKWDKTGL